MVLTVLFAFQMNGSKRLNPLASGLSLHHFDKPLFY